MIPLKKKRCYHSLVTTRTVSSTDPFFECVRVCDVRTI
uniref:Uncharacterized protein n=1 Tax=Setaria italica TaxID=4555 RepID=K4A4I1_SETIT